MNIIDAIKILNGISAYQKGLFTTKQAEYDGVGRHIVSRLEKRGNIERLAQGVYRMGGAPSVREEDVFAIWLSLDPGRIPGAPPENTSPVAMGATAAWLFELGELNPSPYEFCSRTRRQSQRLNVKIRKRTLQDQDTMLVHGIPATSPERTIIDLIDYGEDISLVANVLKDAIKRNLIDDAPSLKVKVDERGVKVGISKRQSLYEIMTEEKRK